MKKLIALLLVLTLILSLAACGKKEEAPAAPETPEVETETPEAEVPVDPEAEDTVIEMEPVDPEADVPAAPTEEPDVPAAMPAVPETPAVTPEVPAEPETPAADSVDLVAFYNEIYEKLYPLDADGNPTGPFVSDMAEMQEMVDAFYPGLSALGVKQLHIFMPAMSGVPYELVLVEAANAADVEAVKTALQSRIDTEKANQMNYPAVQENWAVNSRVVSNGAYVLMAVCADCDAYVEAFNNLF